MTLKQQVRERDIRTEVVPAEAEVLMADSSKVPGHKWAQVIASGATGATPAATAYNNGLLYFDTTTQILYRSSGSAWVQVAAGVTAAGGASRTFPFFMGG